MEESKLFSWLDSGFLPVMLLKSLRLWRQSSNLNINISAVYAIIEKQDYFQHVCYLPYLTGDLWWLGIQINNTNVLVYFSMSNQYQYYVYTDKQALTMV